MSNPFLCQVIISTSKNKFDFLEINVIIGLLLYYLIYFNMLMKKQDFEQYITNFYDINPDNLEDEYIKVVKAFYIFANLTSESYADQLVAKDNVKKLSAKAFLQAKENKDTDKKAEAKVNADPIVVKAKADLITKIRKWEEYKGHKETTMLKTEMLKSIGFNRKQDLNVTGDS